MCAVMDVLWIMVWLATLAEGKSRVLTDEEYYQMPKLFEMDDYEECLSRPEGTFCLGSFNLAARTNTHLMRLIEKYSSDRFHFNRSRIHRGLCLSKSCAHVAEPGRRPPAPADHFEACVDNLTRTHHGLSAHLYSLDYCETPTSPPIMPMDEVDLIYAFIVLIILAANVIGTLYDLLRNPDNKPNRYLMLWSFRVNWNRLTATYEDGDPRLNKLNPVHGIKAINMMFVMMAHSVIAYHMTYIQNPQFFENANRHFLASILHNGSVIVQTFIMLSSFLLAYNLLLNREKDPEKGLSLRLFPKVMLQRISRITPAYVLVVGAAATWWRLAAGGPLWGAVRAEAALCRRRWWLHALYIHNLVQPDPRCLLPTWFLAVDMQLYVVAALLTLLLAGKPRLATWLLTGLFFAAIAANYCVSYVFDLKPMVFITYPEPLRHELAGEPSFSWLYTAPWGSLPATLLGLLVAFLYYNMLQDGVHLQDKMWFRLLYRVSVPCMLAWILAGHCVRRAAATREAVAFYAAIDRPVFAVIVVVAMLGFIFQVDNLYWRLMRWDGWRPLSRMSLSVLLAHWLLAVGQLAIRTTPSNTSVLEIGGHLLTTMLLTYLMSLPLHLLVELPLQKFLQALFIR